MALGPESRPTISAGYDASIIQSSLPKLNARIWMIREEARRKGINRSQSSSTKQAPEKLAAFV